jgi:hypothetical protein
VVAGIRLSPHGTVNIGSDERWRKGGAYQQMVESQTRIACPPIPHVVPERVHALLAMQVTDRIGPALLHKARIGGATLGLHQSVVIP